MSQYMAQYDIPTCSSFLFAPRKHIDLIFVAQHARVN